MIRPLTFIDVSSFTAFFLVKHRKHMQDGVLRLRDVEPEGDSVIDLPLLEDWPSARAVLLKIRNGAAAVFKEAVPELGRAWIETLPPESGTPWAVEGGDYANEHVRLRICMVPAPDAYSFSGTASAILGPGVVNLVEHRVLCSEVNLGSYPRTHLVVDVRRPEEG